MRTPPSPGVPPGWVSAPLGDVAEINPRRLEMEPTDSELVSFVPMPAVEAGTGRLDPTATRSWGEVKRGHTRFQNGDLLVAKITPCMENGKFALATGLRGGVGAGSTEFHVVRPTGGIQGRYLLHLLLQESVRREARAAMQGAAGQLRVPVGFLESVVVPLAPLAEQARIVAALDQHLTRLDAAVEALRRVRAKLKTYRASVLKAACEGRLVPTEAELARREGRGYETGADLLRRLGVEATCEPGLAEGWAAARVGCLADAVDYGSSAKTNGDESGVPVLRMGNIVDGRLDLTELKHLPRDHDEFPHLLLRSGDVLFNRTNSPELVGKTAVYRGTPRTCSFASYLIRVRLSQGYVPELLVYCINSAAGRSWIASVVTQQVGQANVNGTKLRNFVVPVPPLAEQHRIVAEVERRFSVVEKLEGVVETGLERAEKLRQAILKRAFEGKLVPQDPNDEPASVLLERIRAERAAAEANGCRLREKRSGPRKAPRGRGAVRGRPNQSR